MQLISSDLHPTHRTASEAIAFLRSRGCCVTDYYEKWLAHNLTGDAGIRLPHRKPSASMFITFTVRIYDHEGP
jgi:hypothetical protein